MSIWKTDDGSKRRTEKWQWWLWTPKLRNDDDDFERQTEDATLNVDLKIDDGSERRTENTVMALNVELKVVIMALNAETEDATLNVNLKTDDGSERRTENTLMTLNAETEKWWWLWTPNWK